ncbi:hypothetical protein BKA83DRAFT_4246811, partial [Pisolithus microcarpus]
AVYVVPKSGTSHITSRPSCNVLVGRCDRTTQQLPGNHLLLPCASPIRKETKVAPWSLSHHRTVERRCSESHPYLLFAPFIPFYTSSLIVPVSTLCPPRSSYRCVFHSAVLASLIHRYSPHHLSVERSRIASLPALLHSICTHGESHLFGQDTE